MKKIYQSYCNYNLWANQRLTAVFKDLPEERADQFIENSFPSAKKTVLHIWDAEAIWLKRLQGHHVASFPSKDFTGTAQDAIQGLLATSASFRDFVQVQDDAFFENPFTVQTITAGVYTQLAGEMVHHCMNHSTYHRGQLLMMARQLGLTDLPSTDMIFFLREKAVHEVQ